MVTRNSPEQKNRFLAAQARAMQTARAKRDRSRPARVTGPSAVQVAAEQSAAQAAAAVPASDPTPDDGFDPADHTVDEVVSHIEQHPDDLKAVLKAEKSGKARAGVLALGD